MYRYRYLKTKYTDRYTGIPHPKHGFLMTKNMGSTWINGTNRHPKDRMDSTKQCFFRPPKLSSFDPYIHITYIYMYIYMYIHIIYIYNYIYLIILKNIYIYIHIVYMYLYTHTYRYIQTQITSNQHSQASIYGQPSDLLFPEAEGIAQSRGSVAPGNEPHSQQILDPRSHAAPRDL